MERQRLIMLAVAVVLVDSALLQVFQLQQVLLIPLLWALAGLAGLAGPQVLLVLELAE